MGRKYVKAVHAIQQFTVAYNNRVPHTVFRSNITLRSHIAQSTLLNKTECSNVYI